MNEKLYRVPWGTATLETILDPHTCGVCGTYRHIDANGTREKCAKCGDPEIRLWDDDMYSQRDEHVVPFDDEIHDVR